MWMGALPPNKGIRGGGGLGGGDFSLPISVVVTSLSQCVKFTLVCQHSLGMVVKEIKFNQTPVSVNSSEEKTQRALKCSVNQPVESRPKIGQAFRFFHTHCFNCSYHL